MLAIKVGIDTATWEDRAATWSSPEILFESLCNSTIPDEAKQVDSPFLEGGLQGMALKGVQDFFGKELEIVKQTEAWYPPDKEGVVY